MVDLIQSWHVVKHEVPQEWDTCQTRPANLTIDAVKARVFNAIMKIDQMDDVAKSIRFWKKPDHVRTGEQPIPKGKLVLAPCLPMSNIGIKHGPTSVSFGNVTHGNPWEDKWSGQLFGFPPPKPRPDETDFQHVMMAAFWWVAGTSDNDLVNMEVHESSVDGIKIPTLRNNRVLKPFTKLYKFQPLAPVKTSSLKIEPAAKPADKPAKKPAEKPPAEKPAAKKRKSGGR
jgi:hypothetical protein